MPNKTGGDADVLANRFGLVGAGGLSGVRSMLGAGKLRMADVGGDEKDEDYGFQKEDFGHDRAGVGMSQPKGIEDGTFTKHVATSESKLLEQMIGKKRAKAYYATQQPKQPERTQTKAQKDNRPRLKKEESDDEDEGRAAMFESKRRKVDSAKVVEGRQEVRDDTGYTEEGLVQAETESPKQFFDEAARIEEKTKHEPKTSKWKAKPTSFLDEILADRSRKKKNKKLTS